MNIAHSVKINGKEMNVPKSMIQDHEKESEEPSDSNLALLKVKFDKEMCEAFVDFSQRHKRHEVVDDPEKSQVCDKQREELQKAFEEAFKETRVLKEESRKRTVDTTCFTTAEAVKMAELVPLVSQ